MEGTLSIPVLVVPFEFEEPNVHLVAFRGRHKAYWVYHFAYVTHNVPHRLLHLFRPNENADGENSCFDDRAPHALHLGVVHDVRQNEGGVDFEMVWIHLLADQTVGGQRHLKGAGLNCCT